MRRSRLVFSRYNPTKRQQQRKQIALAIGAGVSLLLIGGAVVATRNGSGLRQFTARLPFGAQNALMSGQKVDTPTLTLVSLPASKRAVQLTEIAQGESSLDRSRARYLLAVEAIELGQGETALRWLEELESEYPVLAAYVLLKRAQAYEIMGNEEEASEAWQTLLKRYPDHPVAAHALYALANDNPQYWEKAKDASYRPRFWEIARHLYAFSPDDPQYWEQAIAKYPSHPLILKLAEQRIKQDPDQPKLMLLLAKYAFDKPETTLVLDKLVSNYTNAVGSDYEKIIQPEDWEAIALSYWRAKKYGQASSAYAKAPPSPRHAYLTALGLQYAEKPNEAKRAYKELLSNFPNTEEAANAYLRMAEIETPREALSSLSEIDGQFPEQAGQALLVKARILDRLRVSEAATNTREILLTDYGKSEAAAEYRWQVAQEKASSGDLNAARKWAQQITTENAKSHVAREAGFWFGKWSRTLGYQQEAKAAFEQVVAQHPQSYYAWRSAVMLGWNVGDFTTVRQQTPKVLSPVERPLLPVGSAALQELYQLGQSKDAWTLWQAEFQNRLEPTVAEQFTDGLMHLEIGEHLEGIALIATLEDREDPEEQAEYQSIRQELTYWQGLYPFPFQEMINTYSKERQLNPLLVTALIRQESRFEPDIKSTAGAVGLMQMLPTTGNWAAEELNVEDYALENPEDNVKLGTWFLAQTHQAYNNNSLLAVASYNAGQGNLGKWLKGGKPTDPDEFVESIPFDETKDYVKQVFGNYWNYLRLYEPEVAEKLAKYNVAPSTAMRP
jgi:soluble lytic murein transglycosylase